MDRILDLDRNPRLAEDVSHDYTDKYALANSMTNTAIISQMNVLHRIGLSNDVLQKIDSTKATTLRFHAFDSCQFVKEQVVDVPVPTTFETTEETKTTGTFFGSTKKSTVHQIVNRVKEFHWNVEVKWEISVYSGTDIDERIVLDSRTASTTLIVQSEQKAPLPERREHKPIDVSLTWLLQQIDKDNSFVHFTIDTQNKETKTPRRNKQVEGALDFFVHLSNWAKGVNRHFVCLYTNDIVHKHNPAIPSPFNTIVGNSQELSKLDANVFIPIIPLMEDTEDGEGEEQENQTTEHPISQSASAVPAATTDRNDRSKGRVLSSSDMVLLLNAQTQNLDKVLESLQKGYPDRQSNYLISVTEAKIYVLFLHLSKLVLAHQRSIEYIEKMLEDQLVAAIGKRVTSADLDQFVRYHNAKMLSPAPKPFCHSIRRPNHYPEGILSIESDKALKDRVEPIETHVREVDGLSSLKFPLNAATTLELTGKTYLHGWLNHRFCSAHSNFQLIGRARQFSSFMLVVGTMVGPDRMQPKDAIILQNKDEIKIPLLLTEIPTAKEFKDAIESLSPEQQRFAKAYRSMQLESSVLGVCVIQIKPQLEDLLGLPHDALTKEMQLTQDLMELFVEYQVPSDMLSYDGENEEATTKDMVDNVKEHVKAVLDVIQEAKKKQLKDQEMKTDMAVEKKFAALPAFQGSAAANYDSFRTGSRRLKPSFKPRSDAIAFGSVGSAAGSPFGGYGSAAISFPPGGGDLSSPGTSSPGAVDMSLIMASNIAEDSAFDSSNEIEEEAGDFPDFPEDAPTPGRSGDTTTSKTCTLNFTAIPKLLDEAIEKYDVDSALRSTTIKTSDNWVRERQENLLTKAKVNTFCSADIKSEKNKAFDLLDALSRSGSLPVPYSELHVIVCVTHCFEKNVMETVIQDNVNPIEKLEWSTLLLASTVHGVPAKALISNSSDRLRLNASFPALLQCDAAES